MKIELDMDDMTSLMWACVICANERDDEESDDWWILYDKLYEAFDKAYNMKVHGGC